MFSLLKTEWLKIRKYPAFWLLIGLCILSYPGINYIFLNMYESIVKKENAAGKMIGMFLGDPFTFPEIWRTSAYLTSVFVFIPAVLVIMLVTNEYTYKTNRQNIIDGWSRRDFMVAKLIDVILIVLMITFLYAGVAYFIGTTNTAGKTVNHWSLAYYIALFALQTFSQLSLAFLVGLVVRKSFIALAIFMFYSIVAEPIAVNLLRYKYFKNDIGRFFPLELSDRIIPPPAFMSRFDEKAYQGALDAVNNHIVYTLILVLITWGINYLVYLKRDL
ncbi:ABC transporter permease subunit [Flavihumibacter fluvii]|uniref:ABC transporter permease subunit n=1 Tax=Flavihumibacter fluvii TaxID=2838157 RepID=UPI001BDDDB3F|nr:ABC transporter permease subunit [Flavihumibacter fluvii]ULQ52639.1 ABC transporter permease [Flavihumibacter fluvii]